MATKESNKTRTAPASNESNSETISNIKSPWKNISKGVGVSGMMGAAVGVATKRLTRDAFYGAGLAIIVLQSLNYLGYIQINWRKVEEQVRAAVDQNNDGKLDKKDLKILLDRFLKFTSNGISDVGGFTAGFFFGAKYLA